MKVLRKTDKNQGFITLIKVLSPLKSERLIVTIKLTFHKVLIESSCLPFLGIYGIRLLNYSACKTRLSAPLATLQSTLRFSRGYHTPVRVLQIARSYEIMTMAIFVT
jgi:hypothetical protein